MTKKIYTIKYRRVKLRLPFNPRTGVCECCGKKAKTQLHHWSYKYKTKEVKKNKVLALENTTELCYPHHLLANSLKHILDNKELTRKLWLSRKTAIHLKWKKIK